MTELGQPVAIGLSCAHTLVVEAARLFAICPFGAGLAHWWGSSVSVTRHVPIIRHQPARKGIGYDRTHLQGELKVGSGRYRPETIGASSG